MKVQHKYLSHFGQTNYLGAKYKGLKSNFTITDTGLLAAIFCNNLSIIPSLAYTIPNTPPLLPFQLDSQN